MAGWTIEPGDIADLTTPVAMRGSLRVDDVMPDDIFDMIVAIASLVTGID
ncbi:hypothetical protein [Stakelama tenebrarum]|uniref:Uncharacterized protein n=1 Tax=Stakelama tenebrarum TaxID=2711215 RepID=A0A6G6Y2Y0_9SPHN|nr:hypothetical protein [Sphingosinithalassobacter tenebrarum]QIG78926.1 hypothetical protein G5C33_03405 [Sphingosinithalassobacter tenebrarum]